MLPENLIHLWDYDNNDIDPVTISPGSHKKVNWKCDQGHTWARQIKIQNNVRYSCPYCSGQLPISGVNDLGTVVPESWEWWDKEDNGILIPSDFLPHSNKKMSWRCPKGHTWKSTIGSFTRGLRCSVCSGKKVLSGFNDLATVKPDVISWWDYEKNTILPTEITRASSVRVWWKCEKNHSWESSVNNVTVNGSRCPVCAGRRVIPGDNDLYTTHPEIASEWDYEYNHPVTPKDVTHGSDTPFRWMCSNGHTWITETRHRVRGNGCPYCVSSTSQQEEELASFVISITSNVVIGTRSVIPPYELDIFIPEKKIAIEFNGVYWHSEKFRDKNYHYNKWKKCKDKGIQLIIIWEDEWRDKKDIAKSMLSHKLMSDSSSRVYARNAAVKEIDYSEASLFLINHHIQGTTSGSLYLALHEGNEIIAVSVWRKNKNTLYLDRYATSCTVIGGMGKLLKQGIQYAKDNGCTEIVTFSDHQVSNGGLYEKLGFQLDKELYPDYMYVHRNTREHKFGYRLKRFRTDPGLKYVEGMTEKELASLNKLNRVWDCGKSRYIYDIP